MTRLNDIPEEDLPDWIQLAVRGTDWGVLIVLCIALLSGWSFIWYTELPNSPFYESYLWRVSELSQMMEEGTLFPRWSYYALNGYGAPIYHYLPPSASYASAIIATLFTGDAGNAIRIFILLSLCLAGGTLYGLLVHLADARVGLLGATLYLVNPFTLSTILFRTGYLDLLLVMALLPALLWAVVRWLTQKNALNFVMVVVVGGGLLLAHSSFWVLASVFIGGLIWHRRDWWAITGLGVACLGSLSLTGFYWIPALLEQSHLTWLMAYATTPPEVIHLSDILSLPQAIDSALVTPEMSVSLGYWLPAMGLGGVVVLLWQKSGERFFYLSGLVGAMGIVGAIVTQDYALLILSVLGLSISGAVMSRLFDRLALRWTRLYLASLLIMTIIFTQASWIGTGRLVTTQSPSLESYMRSVIADYGQIILPVTQAMPSTLGVIPPAERNVIREYLSGQNAHLFSNRADGIQIDLVASRGLYQRYQFHAQTPLRLVSQQAYFEGWQARVNGQRIAVERDEATGFLALYLPAMQRGELELMLGTTSVRTAGWLMSWTTVVCLLWYAWRRKVVSGRRILGYRRYLKLEDARLIGTGLSAVVVVAVILASDIWGNLPMRLQLSTASSLQDVRRVQYPTEVGLKVIGFDVENPQIRHGERVVLRLWWQTSRSISENYHARVILRNVNNHQAWVWSPIQRIGHYPTQRWGRDAIALDRHIVDIPSDLATGRYSLSVLLIQCMDTCDTTRNMHFFDRFGNAIGTHLTLPQIITVQADSLLLEGADYTIQNASDGEALSG